MIHNSNAAVHRIGCDLDEDCSCGTSTTLATSAPCRGCGSIHAVAVELRDLADGRRRAEVERVSCERARGWYMRRNEDE